MPLNFAPSEIVKLGGTRPLSAKFRFHKGVEVTVKDRFHIARFVISAVVLH